MFYMFNIKVPLNIGKCNSKLKDKRKCSSKLLRALRMVNKNLEKRLKELEIKEKTETIETTALLKSVMKIRRVVEI